jgi:acylphosphatase
VAQNEVGRQRREILFRGRVQGVGFRYTTRHIASRFNVTGYVKNLPDGRVQLVVEGTSDEIERFVAAIAAELDRYIADTTEDVSAATGEFQGFEIRF